MGTAGVDLKTNVAAVCCVMIFVVVRVWEQQGWRYNEANGTEALPDYCWHMLGRHHTTSRLSLLHTHSLVGWCQEKIFVYSANYVVFFLLLQLPINLQNRYLRYYY